jgi:hypothetical protein
MEKCSRKEMFFIAIFSTNSGAIPEISRNFPQTNLLTFKLSELTDMWF